MSDGHARRFVCSRNFVLLTPRYEIILQGSQIHSTAREIYQFGIETRYVASKRYFAARPRFASTRASRTSATYTGHVRTPSKWILSSLVCSIINQYQPRRALQIISVGRLCGPFARSTQQGLGLSDRWWFTRQTPNGTHMHVFHDASNKTTGNLYTRTRAGLARQPSGRLAGGKCQQTFVERVQIGARVLVRPVQTAIDIDKRVQFASTFAGLAANRFTRPSVTKCQYSRINLPRYYAVHVIF